MSDQPQARHASQEIEERIERSGSITFLTISNLVILVILTLVLFFTGISDMLSRVESLKCRSDFGIALGSAFIIWAFFLIVWRRISLEEGFDVNWEREIGGMNIKLGTSLIDRFHPWRLADWVIYLGGFLIIVLSILLGFTGLSPFPVTEAPPIVRDFDVQGYDSPVAPGSTITLTRGSAVGIVANFPPGASPQCTWYVEEGGLTPAPACAINYHLPYEENDLIQVTAEAQCSALSHVASLHVVVADRR